MAGLDMGHKYMYKHNVRESSKEKKGVTYGYKSNKWLVRIKNTSKSRFVRPFIIVAQFDKKEDAEKHFKKLKH